MHALHFAPHLAVPSPCSKYAVAASGADLSGSALVAAR